MSILRHSQSVSLAHRYWNNLWSHERNRTTYGDHASSEGVGSNLRVELEVQGEEFDFFPVAKRIKSLLDHRSLFDDEPAFLERPSTLEGVSCFLAEQIFQTPVQNGRWSALTVWELDRYACRVEPGSTAVDFSLSFRNLLLTFRGPVNPESLLAVDRGPVERALEEIFIQFSTGNNEPEFIWLERLFKVLQNRLPGLFSLQVDLGSHKLMKVDDSLKSLR